MALPTTNHARNDLIIKAMKINAEVITRIQTAMSDRGMNESDLAKKIGVHRSTINTLLKGKKPSIKKEMVDDLNDALGIDLDPIHFRDGDVSPTALELSQLAENDARFAGLLETLIRLAKPNLDPFLPQVHQKKLPKIGAGITQIVARWDEAADPHYSKIAVEVLDLLRKFYTKENGSK